MQDAGKVKLTTFWVRKGPITIDFFEKAATTNSISNGKLALSAWAVEYTDSISAEGEDHPPTSVLKMTLNNLMVRFQ